MTTTLSDFQSSIRTTGGYRTNDLCRAPERAKTSPFLTFKYTWGVSQVFPTSALLEACGKLTTEAWAKSCFHVVTAAEAAGMNVVVEGFEQRLAEKSSVVYLCNHMSMTETILLPPILLSISPFSYVAKASLAHLPFLEKAAAHMRMVPISRTSPRQDLISILKIGTERLQSGESFLIFPQGTRCEVFSRQKYSSIGAKLAERAGCPIVPIVVDTRCQPTRKTGLLSKVFKDFGPVDPKYDIRVSCGPVIPCSTAKTMHAAAFDWMAGKLESWNLPVER